MILPPDNKSAAGPQSSSSEVDTAETSSQSTTPPRPPIGTHYADRPMPYSQVWRNPNGTREETAPLLDPEYVPAPPYSPQDPSNLPDDIAAKTTAIQRTRRRFWMALPLAILIYLAVLLISDMIISLIPEDSRPGNGRHHPGGGPPDEQERNDGSPIECPSFPADGWKPYGKRQNNGMFYMSQKKKVYVNAANVDENFVHLAGPRSIGAIFVDTYPSYSEWGADITPPPEAGEGEVVILDADTRDPPTEDEIRAMYSARGMIRIVIEPVIRVLEEGVQPTMENSPGLAMLAESHICVMQKDTTPTNRTMISTPPRHSHRKPRSSDSSNSSDDDGGEYKVFTSQGLGVYTYKPRDANKRESDHYNDALGFNLYISLPEAFPPTFMELLLIAMGYEVPRDYVRSFEIRADVSEIVINAPQQRMGRLFLNTVVGSIKFTNFVAEYIKVRSQAGSIRGSLDVSSMLDLSSASGEIDLDVSLATAPSPLIWTPPGIDHPINVKGGRGCDLPAIVVNAKSQAGSLHLRYNKWSQMCRGLKQNLATFAGSISVQGHPVYEGPYRAASQIGSIDIKRDDSAQDPTMRTRRRTGWEQKDDTIVGSCKYGEVKWATDRGPARGWDPLLNTTDSAFASVMRAGSGKCPKVGIDPGSEDYDPMASTFNAESTAGSINVVF